MVESRVAETIDSDPRSNDVLEEWRSKYDGSVSYFGTREAFEKSGLIPDGLAFPGDMPGMKGARWYGLDQRSYAMSKWKRIPGGFRLNVLPSKAQLVQLRLDTERDKKLKAIESELAAANKSEASYRADVARFALLGKAAFNADLHGPHGWSYESSVVSEVHALFDEISELLRTGGVQRDLTERNRLRTQRAALLDQGLQRFLCAVQQ